MKHFFIAAASACSILFIAPAWAAKVDPLWSKTVDNFKTLSKWVAQDIETQLHLEVDGKMQTFTVKSHLSAWGKGKPVYSVVSRDPPLEPGMPAKKSPSMEFLSNQMGGILTADADVKRFDGQTLGGRSLTLFHLEESQMGTKLSFKVWVDPVSGVPQQSETKTRIPMLMDMHMSTTYTELPRIGVVEKQSDIAFESLVPFKNKKGRTIVKPTSWIARPI